MPQRIRTWCEFNFAYWNASGTESLFKDAVRAQFRPAWILNTGGQSDPHLTAVTTMIQIQTSTTDPKAVSIFAKSIYRELRASGYSGEDVMHLAGELLSLLTRDVKGEEPRPAI